MFLGFAPLNHAYVTLFKNIENIYNKDDEFKSCVRKIDWNRGNPYVWTNDDFDELMRSDAIFARKFDNSDMEIVKRIKKGVME